MVAVMAMAVVVKVVVASVVMPVMVILFAFASSVKKA